jgi:hypothetical protein
MSDCQSLFGVVEKLYPQYIEYVKLLPGIAVGISTGNPAAAAAAVKAAGKVEQVLGHFYEVWNKMDGPAHLGARDLPLNTPCTGSIFSKGERMFVTPAPIHADRVRVRITEQDGKGKTDIRVCLLDGTGSHEDVRITDTWNESNDEKDNSSQKLDKVVENTLGKYLVVHFSGHSLLDKMNYTLQVTPE